MQKLLLLFLAVNLHIYGATQKDFESDLIAAPLANLESEPNGIINNSVNVITGDYTDFQVDIMIPGPEPLTLERAYISSCRSIGTLCGSWFLNHHARLMPSKDDASIEEAFGSSLRFKRTGTWKKNKLLTPRGRQFNKWVTNTGSGLMSQRTNLKNHEIFYSAPPKESYLRRANGDLCHYKINKMYNYIHLIDSVKKLTGNQTSYVHYSDMRLKLIENKNAENELFSSLKFSYPKGKKNPKVTVTASDGRQITYGFTRFHIPGLIEKQYFLDDVQRPNAPREWYEYHTGKKENAHRIVKKNRPEGRFLENIYYEKGKNDNGIEVKKKDDPRIGRVMRQKAPVGNDDTPIVTHTFYYDIQTKKRKNISPEILEGKTTVIDALGHQVVYEHNAEHRLQSIRRYTGTSDYQLYSVEKMYWDGMLLKSRSYENSEGQEVFRRDFVYDEYGNVVIDRLWGDLQGYGIRDCVEKQFGYNSMGCMLWEDDGVRRISYGYVEGTDLLAWKFEGFRKRNFYHYDTNGTLIREVIDDGTGQEESDLSGVTQRLIRIIVPTDFAPVGLPGVIEEKYWDGNSKIEKLLKRTENFYSREGWLIQQDIYGADGLYAYSLEWNYDSLGNVIWERDAMGEEIIREFDANGNCVLERGPLPEMQVKRVYDFSNRLIREEIAPDQVISYEYDLLGNQIAKIDEYGNRTEFRYDAFGRCIETIHPKVFNGKGEKGNPRERILYDAMSCPVEVTDPEGNLMQRRYTVRGQVAEVNHSDGSSEHFSYTKQGKLHRAKAANGVETIHEYDDQGRLIHKQVLGREGLATEQQWIYDGWHLVCEIDPSGLETHFTYDWAGNLIEKRRGSEYTQYRYDVLGRCVEERQWTGKEWLIQGKSYDFKDQLIEEWKESESTGITHCISYEYDAAGRRIAKKNGTMMERWEYDARGRITKTIHADGFCNLIEYASDLNSMGQRVAVRTEIDPKGRKTIKVHDALGRIISSTRWNAFCDLLQKRIYAYDFSGNRTRLEEYAVDEGARSVWVEWEYDSRGREICCSESGQKVTRITYDNYGQKSEVIKPDGEVLRHEYDGRGRLSRLISNRVVYGYSYDLMDRVIEVEDSANQSTQCRYSLEGRMIAETLGNGLEILYEYDCLGRIIGLTYPDFSQSKYEYEGPYLREIIRLNAAGEEQYRHSYTKYDEEGRLREEDLIGSTGRVRFSYDQMGRVSDMNSVHFTESLTYDCVGNVTSSRLNGTVLDYLYDELDQLRIEPGHRYEYDSLFQRTEKNGRVYQVNSLNQVLDDGISVYKFDANGNRVQKGDHIYCYDGWNRLVGVMLGWQQVRFRYDARHRRLAKEFWEWEEGQWQKKREQKYLYVGENEVGAVNEDGEVEELRLLGIGKGAEIGAAVAIEVKGNTYVPLHDHSGNLRVLVDPDSGEKVESYSLSAFGEEGSSGISPWRFSSKRVDEELGIIFFGRRYYDPELGSWLSPDPIGITDNSHLYAYVQNNPLAHVDLYGLHIEGQRMHYHVQHSFWCNMVSAPGRFIRAMGDHCLPVPVVRDAVSATGHLMSGGKLRGYRMSFHQPHSGNYDLGHKESKDQVRVLFNNGICNTLGEARNAAENISKRYGGLNVHYSYNASHGFMSDIFECVGQKLGFRTNSVRKMIHSMRDQIRAVGGTGGDGRVYVLAHSQGGLITDLALQHLTPSERKMMHVQTFGTARIIDSKGLGDAQNYINSRDAIPMISDPVNYFQAKSKRPQHVTFLKSSTMPFIDHLLSGSNYQAAIQHSGKQFSSMHGGL